MSDQFRGLKCNLEGDIFFDSLILVNTTGAFCDLFTATHPTAGKLALKRPRGDCYDKNVIARIEIEASVWKMLWNPRILQFLGICKIGEKIYLVSPFAENGSLPGFLNARPDVDRRRLVIEIAEGLTYLHRCGIIHGDLKGNNILISNEEHVLLCDFGLAKHVTSRTSTSLRGVGSIPWQSPELLRDASRRTVQSDVYALGITIYEVLSGREPYVDYNGIGAIIAGVLFDAERPPKEPLTTPNGTSYLELWDEASKCWDEDPTRRPSIASVLTRLDHERAEQWITAQQIALESSLDTCVDIGPMPRSASISDSQLSMAHITDTTETLRWAQSIRSRLTTFVNSKQPISRMTPELLAAVVLQDDTKIHLHYGPSLSYEEQRIQSKWSHIFRSAQLRRVSRAWRSAIDTSKALCSFVWVEYDSGNTEYIQQCNPDGPLECWVSGVRPTSTVTILRPFTHRITHMAIGSPIHYVAELFELLEFPKLGHIRFTANSQERSLQRGFIPINLVTNSLMALVLEKVSFSVFHPTIFALLCTIKITTTVAHDTFIGDFFAVLSISPNLTELVLERLSSEQGLEGSPPSRVSHARLQRMRLDRIPPPILSAILLYLDAENLLSLSAGPIELSHLTGPDSVFAKTIRNLNRGAHSPEHNGGLWIRSGVRPDENWLVLTWSTLTYAPYDKVKTITGGDIWDWNSIGTSHVSNGDARTLLHVLFNLGIKVNWVTLDTDFGGLATESLDQSLGLLSPQSHSWLEILTNLDFVKKMIIGVGVLDAALKHLSEPVRGVIGSSQYLCPHMTHLEVRTQLEVFGQKIQTCFERTSDDGNKQQIHRMGHQS